MEAWLNLLDRYGFPTAFIVVSFLLFWRLVRWCEPRADRIVNAHVSFVEKTGDAVSAINTELQVRGPKLDEVHEMVAEIRARGCGRDGRPNKQSLDGANA